jgi:urea transport system substrate-binding protein
MTCHARDPKWLGTARAAALACVLGGVQPAFAEDTIKVGVLHSLSGTMAPSETLLKDAALMAIDDINASGGVLGRKLQTVVLDPASNWPLFAEQARALLSEEKVAVVFGCWTSVSRKAVLPVFEELNGLLFFPVPYEGEEISRNVFYTGTVPNQKAIPAVEYLLSQQGGGIKRFVLLGTDYVYPRTTNKILRAFLHSKGIPDTNIIEKYVPFGHSDFQTIALDIETFAAVGRTAVISSIFGDSNVPFYRELTTLGLKAPAVPVLSLSLAEQELHGLDTTPFVGRLAAWNYFMSLKNPVNDAWKQQWTAYLSRKNRLTDDAPPTSDPMEATWIGVHLWKQAVEKAGTTDVDKVIAAMAGQKFKAPDGFTVEMDTKNHHLHRPVFIGALEADGQFKVVWKSYAPLKAKPFSPFIPGNTKKKDEPSAVV